MQLKIISSWQELPPKAISLLDHFDSISPFMGSSWFSLFHRYVAESLGEQKWLILEDTDKVLAILPMLECQDGKTRILKSLTNYYSPYFELICEPENKATLLQILTQKSEHYFKQFDRIEISPLTPENHSLISSSFRNIGFHIHSYVHTVNWQLKSIGDFDHYWKSRSSRLRNTVARKLKKITKTNEFEFMVFKSGDINSALIDYHEVYFKSWKNNEPYPAFIDELARKSSNTDKLRLGFLFKEGQAVATQLWLTSTKTAYIFKLAYDPDYAKQSVGSLLSYFMFREAIETDHVETIDYLTGNDNYKASWMDTKRNLQGIHCSNTKTLRGTISKVKNQTSTTIKKIAFKN